MADHDVRSPEKECQILDGAAAAFAQDGYEGASMSHIAAMAGVSKGTLYNYFDSKKDLFAAFVQRECSQRLLLVFDEIDSQAAVQATLLRVGRRILELMISQTGLLTYRMVIAEAHKFPELAEAFHEAGPRRAISRLSTLIRQMSQAGQLDVPDPVFAAEQLFALMTAGLVMRRRMGLVPSASDAEIDHVVQEAVKLFLRGYGT